MATIKEIAQNDCTGCEACANICPKNCISFQKDKEGFYYPQIDEEVCIGCGACYTVCKKREGAGSVNFEAVAKAAFVKEEEMLKKSSSGGVFGCLAEYILERKGVVYGAALKDMRIEHMRITSLKDLHWIQKSKYLQSRMNSAYSLAKEDLLAGKMVLFSGTPCQIGGLKAYLGKQYENLYTCDVVCHGVPSERVFEEYIKYAEKKAGSRMVSMNWRDKRNGWRPNSIVEFYENGKEKVCQSMEHPFQRGFLENLYLRPSCYECKFTGIPRIADVSLADFWGADQYDVAFAQTNDNKGLSIVILSSEKGMQLFEHIKKKLNWKDLDLEIVKKSSRHAYLPPVLNEKRKEFFEELDKRPYHRLIKKYILPREKKNYVLLCKIKGKSMLQKLQQKIGANKHGR